MGAIQYDEKSGSIEITYGGREAPFTGVDSSAPPPYIGVGAQTPDSLNVICIDNSLRVVNWLEHDFPTGARFFVGFGDLLGVVFGVEYVASSNSINVFNFSDFPTPSVGTLVGNIPTPNFSGTPTLNSLTFKNVNGVCFFSFPGSPYIFQHNGQTAGILTDYLGAAYLNELNGRLLAMDVFQYSAGSGGGGTTLSPSVAGGSASITQSTAGTSTGTSTPASGWASTVIGPTVSVLVNIVPSGQIVINPPFRGTGNINYQYSVNSGTTWATGLAQSSNSTQAYPASPTSFTIPLAALANLNTLQVRVQVQATALSGSNCNVVGDPGVVTATVGSGGGVVPGVVTEYPYQFAWSAAEGQYAIFNPLDVNNLVTGAGFNNLPDVEDTITGYFNVGPTGYILRSQGITEVSPLNSGILPFDFNHLWASHKGIGTIYPTTVSQYGSVGAFLSDTGIYTIGYDGINTIDNKAKSAIYQELIIIAAAENLTMTLGPIQLDGENFLAAVITAQHGAGSAIQYIFNFVSKEWYRTNIDVNFTLTSLAAISVNQNIGLTNINSIYILATGNTSGFTAFSTGVTSGLVVGAAAQIALSGEEIKIGRDITIDGFMIYYQGNLNGNTDFNFKVSLVGGADITIPISVSAGDLIFDSQWHYIKLYPVNSAITNSQMRFFITCATFDTVGIDAVGASFWIGKFVAFGSIDSTQRPM